MIMIRRVYREDEKIPGECTYDRCSYKGCKNGKYRNFKKLFLFPRHSEPERLEKWLQNCGNPELRKKAYSSIRRSGICADHFDASSFSDSSKYFLKRNSIPLPNYPPELGINSIDVESSINKISKGGGISHGKFNSVMNNGFPSSKIIETATIINSKSSSNLQSCVSKVIPRVPRLFEDYDDNFDKSDVEDQASIDLSEIDDRTKISSSLSDDIDTEQQQSEPPKWKKYEVFLSDDESDSMFAKSTIPSDAENSDNLVNSKEQDSGLISEDEQIDGNQTNHEFEETMNEFPPVSKFVNEDDKMKESHADVPTIRMSEIVNTTKSGNPTRKIFHTEGTSVEFVRKLHIELNKDEQLEKLKKQNSMLRKELRRLKNLERLRKQRKDAKPPKKKKMSLKEQKKLILETINDMNISPVSKAIISLQLHTKNAPYSDEEKSLATEFLLYSRSGFKRLKNAGLNFPSTSSLKRWVKGFRDEVEGLPIDTEVEEIDEEEVEEVDKDEVEEVDKDEVEEVDEDVVRVVYKDEDSVHFEDSVGSNPEN